MPVGEQLHNYTLKSAATSRKKPLVLSVKSLSAQGLKAGGSGYAPPDFMLPMSDYQRTISFDSEGCMVDPSLTKTRHLSTKERVARVVHGTIIVFKDEVSAMDAGERREMNRRLRSTGKKAELSSQKLDIN